MPAGPGAVLRRVTDVAVGRSAPAAAVPHRVAVGATVFVSVLATVLQGAVRGPVGVVALVLIPAGFVLSYARRRERNVLLKVALAVGLFAAFAGFLSGVRGAASIDDTRVPLTALFLWVQVLHSFDVPRRRDLGFSLAASIALIALAGSLSFSGGFLVFFVAFTLCLLAALVTGHHADLVERAGPHAAVEAGPAGGPPPVRRLARPVAAVLVGTLACALAVFVALPRLPGAQIASLPFSLAQRAPVPDFGGEVVQPDDLSSGGGNGTAETGFDPDAYFGYGERLDLRLRGRLNHELVMRVRSAEPQLWRAQAYDRYEDAGWTSTDTELQDLEALPDNSIQIPAPPEGWGRAPSHELVQTFYAEQPLPNLVFGAHEVREIFTPATTAKLDDFGSIRLPFVLQEDTIYSVVSRVPDVTVEQLRSSPADVYDHPFFDRYLQIPDSLGPRFHELADRITEPEPTTVDTVLAVQDWLHENKEYRLDIPRDPEDVDPIEVFLFQRDEGFCEQIATSMAMLLRSAGIPTRLVTGFGPGERNLFTGYWEVRNSDAHAWLEVYYPGAGWVPYDPTFGVPVSDATNTTFAALDPLGRALGNLVPTGALRSAADAVSDVAGPAGVVGAVLLLAGIAAGAATALRRRRRPVGWMPTDAPGDRVVAAWLSVERTLAADGCARPDHETVGEFAPRAAAHEGVDGEALRELVRLFTGVRYGGRPVTRDDAVRAEELASRLRAGVREAKPSPFALRR